MQPDSPGTPPLPHHHAELLLALAGALQRAQMYPEDHPTLDRAIEQVAGRLAPVLRDRPAVMFAVAHTRLFAGAAASDPEHPFLRDLASRLFRRNVGTMRLARGVTRSELGALLAVLTRDPHDIVRLRTPHIDVEPLNFEGLALDRHAGGGGEPVLPGSGAIWSALAGAMQGRAEPAENSAVPSGEELALAFDALPPDPARDATVIRFLREAAESCRDRGSPEIHALRREVGLLLCRLRPETLERLLRHSREAAPARGLRADLAALASPGPALEVLQAEARLAGRTLSAPLLRLFRKLAERSERGSLASRYPAADQFFALMDDVLASWESPGIALVEPVDHLPAPLVPGLSAEEAYRSDPLRVLTMQLDMGTLGPAAERAVGTLVARGRVRPLVDLLRGLPADDPLVPIYRPMIAGGAALGALLAAPEVDLEAVEWLAPDVGPAAIPMLLDALARSEERGVRRRLLELLVHFGNPVVPQVLERLPSAPWFVQRNLLRLLQMLPDPPPESVGAEYARHADPRVRVEGFRLLMRHPAARARGIIEGLSDPDSSGVRVAVLAAGEDCPAAAAPLLLQGLSQGRIDPGLVPAAIRALGPMVEIPGVADLLLRFAGRKLPLLGWRVAPKSKNSLAALSALARHWHSDPRTAGLLARAAGHADPDIRRAVAP